MLGNSYITRGQTVWLVVQAETLLRVNGDNIKITSGNRDCLGKLADAVTLARGMGTMRAQGWGGAKAPAQICGSLYRVE